MVRILEKAPETFGREGCLNFQILGLKLGFKTATIKVVMALGREHRAVLPSVNGPLVLLTPVHSGEVNGTLPRMNEDLLWK